MVYHTLPYTMDILILAVIALAVIYILQQTTEGYYTSPPSYPSTNIRRLRTIKQLADDVMRDMNKNVTTQPYIPPTYNPNPFNPSNPYTTPSNPYNQQPTQQANIPDWVRNLDSETAAQQLRILNPGFTVQRLMYGQAYTADYMPTRIRVLYDGNNKVRDITQG